MTAMIVVESSAMPNFLYDSPMLLFGERRKTSSEWGVRVFGLAVKKLCRAMKVAESRCWGEMIYYWRLVWVDGVLAKAIRDDGHAS